MFVRSLEDVRTAGLVVSLGAEEARSARFLTAIDGLGFSYNENVSNRAVDVELWYRNHWEANYIIEGSGTVKDQTTGAEWPMRPGALYVVGPNDRHYLSFAPGVKLISIFFPALRGDEERTDGGYPASGPVPQTDRRMFVKYADEMRAAGEELVIAHGNARSLRMLKKADDLGFSFSVVQSKAGIESDLWYKNHWEANHVLSGKAELTELATGKTWLIEAGMGYCVGPKDRHHVRTIEDLEAISIFNPPLQGDELHDADGALAPSGPIPPGPQS